MAKKVKLTRKQLLKEPDEFITTTGKLIRWAKEHEKKIAWSLGVIFVLLILIVGLNQVSKSNEKAAFDLYTKAMAKYDAAAADNGPQEAYDRVKDDFSEIIDKYSGKNGGKLARIAFADICYNAGDADTAIPMYKSAMDDFGGDPAFKQILINSLGYAYEMKMDLDNAIHYFEMIASGESDMLKSSALFNLGRIYEKKGDREKSLAAFKKIESDFPDSRFLNIVKEKTAG